MAKHPNIVSTTTGNVPNNVEHNSFNEPVIPTVIPKVMTVSSGSVLNDNNIEQGSFAKLFKAKTSRKGANFRTLLAPARNGAE